MESIVLYADSLNLPAIFATKMRGKKVEIAEHNNILTIKPVKSPILAARGMLKGGQFNTAALLAQKQTEKEREYEKEIHA